MRQLQFEVWQDCNSHCDFCYLKGYPHIRTDDEFKLQRLNYVIEKVSDESIIKDYDVISLIGGEFFQGQLNNPLVNKKWYELIDKLAELQRLGKIKQIWILCSLLIGKQPDLYKTIDRIPDKSNLWIATSWDSNGRFKGHMLETWEYHMNKIHELWPEIMLNTTIILTQHFITQYLNDEINLLDFRAKFHTDIYMKPCAVAPNVSIDEVRKEKADYAKIDPLFFPKRSDFQQFLFKVKNCEPEGTFAYLFDVHRRCDDILRLAKDGITPFEQTRGKNLRIQAETDSQINTCGHSTYYCIYSDSDACCLCDKQEIAEL